MKYYTCSSVFKFSWDQVATAFWSRYPNPHSSHVLTEDTVYQATVNGLLHSKRLLTKTNHMPRWGERFVPGPRHVCVIEESVVDPKTKTVTTYTRNIGYTSIMTVEEKCVYRPSSDDNEWTECHREAWINSSVYGFSYALQKFGVERFKNNVSKSFKGFNFALSRLYDAQFVVPTNAIKLRHRAKTATDLAKSVIATNTN